MLQLLRLLAALLPLTLAVDRSNFKTCNQASFCKRQRAFNKNRSPSTYLINENTISIQEQAGRFSAKIRNSKHPSADFVLTLQNYQKEAVRLTIDENSNLFKRFDNKGTYVEEALNPKKFQSIENLPKSADGSTSAGIELGLDDTHKVKISYDPIRLSFYENGEEYLTVNSNNLMNLEHFRPKPENAQASNR